MWGWLSSSRPSSFSGLRQGTPWYQEIFPGTRLTHDQNEKEKFVTTKRGQRIAVSVGGAATGEGGNILIVDDPMNPLQAGQRSLREAANRWFDHTFLTRLHPEDLSGHLLHKGGWEVLSLPAIAPRLVAIRCGSFTKERARGEVLHEAREDTKMLEQMKRELGSANFNAQYQQAPVSEEEGVVKLGWFGRFDLKQFLKEHSA